MKISELKGNHLRNSFIFSIDDEIREVNVFNPTQEQREILLNRIKELSNNDKNDSEIAEELYTDILLNCTDLEIDEPIVDMLANPTGNLLLLMRDIIDIFNELQMEMLLNQYNAINELEKLQYTQLMILKSQKIDIIKKKAEKIQDEIDELKKDD
ncbi:hypothetical protein [uncultured Clostridium sp.]|jgi:hypothetical protein|uniref:hypothetical protein n=1 Tax=uncultured Clostridium sp. TaxID=59620 RepID=UPI0026DC1757|nr:hypothetical protein [uncultured Clostridium sp.]